MVTLENYKWLSKLKPFVSTDSARPGLSAPWLQIKDGNMYICATDGGALVVVAIDDDRAKKIKNEFARLPIFEVGKTPSIDIDTVGATIKAEIRRNDGLPDPPDVFNILEDMQKDRDYTKFLIAPKYITAGANLLKAIFPDKPGVEILPATVKPKRQADAMVMRAENQRFQAVVIIMPVVL
tara:strand:+ start:6216 stop:6758 length:543 start_codon:yes stop_codon:yes gene_type:complete